MRIWHVDVRSRARVCCGDACEPASLVSKMIRGTKFFFLYACCVTFFWWGSLKRHLEVRSKIKCTQLSQSQCLYDFVALPLMIKKKNVAFAVSSRRTKSLRTWHGTCKSATRVCKKFHVFFGSFKKNEGTQLPKTHANIFEGAYKVWQRFCKKENAFQWGYICPLKSHMSTRQWHVFMHGATWFWKG